MLLDTLSLHNAGLFFPLFKISIFSFVVNTLFNQLYIEGGEKRPAPQCTFAITSTEPPPDNL